VLGNARSRTGPLWRLYKLDLRLVTPCPGAVGQPPSGGPMGDLVSYQTSLGIQPSHQPLKHLVIQPQSVRDLVGLDEDRLGFRSGIVGWVLEEVGERAVGQVEGSEAVRDSRRNGSSCRDRRHACQGRS
jgi:hypothetical protein